MSERKEMRLPLFTNRFRKCVDDIGSISKAAELTGISRTTINFWYNGQRTPDAENLITLSQCFNVSSDYLLGIVDDDTPNLDIRAIHQYTGLSSTAIERLHEYNKESRFNGKALSSIIEDDESKDLFKFLMNFYIAVHTLDKYIVWDFGDFKIPHFETETAIDWMKAGLQRVFTIILENMSKTRTEILKKTSESGEEDGKH